MQRLGARREAAIADFVRRVRSVLRNRVVDIRLFGSVARGDAQPDSDIDILVVVEPEDERIRLERQTADIAFDVNMEHDVFISPCVLTAAMLADPVWGRTPFLTAVHREGVAL